MRELRSRTPYRGDYLYLLQGSPGPQTILVLLIKYPHIFPDPKDFFAKTTVSSYIKIYTRYPTEKCALSLFHIILEYSEADSPPGRDHLSQRQQQFL